MLKKLIPVLVAACLVITAIGAAVGTASAQSPWTKIDTGGQGFASTMPNFDKTAKVTVAKSNRVYSIRFVKPVMRLSNSNDPDKTLMVNSLTYVYYDLNSTQQQQWKNGRLKIYYYDSGRSAWVKLNPTTAGIVKGGLQRISAPARNYGLYALGLRSDIPLTKKK